MRRAKEIMKEAEKVASANTQIIGDWGEHYLGFIHGAEWADAHPRWISVEDELPKEDGMYIFLQSGIIYTAMYYKGMALHRDVTHWMPLPSVEHLREATKMIEKGGAL